LELPETDLRQLKYLGDRHSFVQFILTTYHSYPESEWLEFMDFVFGGEADDPNSQNGQVLKKLLALEDQDIKAGHKPLNPTNRDIMNSQQLIFDVVLGSSASQLSTQLQVRTWP